MTKPGKSEFQKKKKSAISLTRSYKPTWKFYVDLGGFVIGPTKSSTLNRMESETYLDNSYLIWNQDTTYFLVTPSPQAPLWLGEKYRVNKSRKFKWTYEAKWVNQHNHWTKSRKVGPVLTNGRVKRTKWSKVEKWIKKHKKFITRKW